MTLMRKLLLYLVLLLFQSLIIGFVFKIIQGAQKVR